MSHTYLEIHGLRIDVEVQDPALLPSVRRILPPGWKPIDDTPEDGHYMIARASDDTFDVLADGEALATGVSADIAVHVLDAQMRSRIASLAQGHVFVHAGVVAVRDRALVIPGSSFSGKSTLVAALVERGATYFSDEFAVLDHDGDVHPYAKPLSLRAADAMYGDLHDIRAIGQVGVTPARIALIAVTRYVPGERWGPRSRSPGAGALALLSNAVPARARSEEVTRTVGKASDGARVLEGDRGEAEQTAALLIEALGP